MIQDYQLMSKQLLQMDNTMCHHPLIQGPQKGHGCLKSLCLFLPLSHKPPSGVRGDYWNTTYFFKKCVLPCILQDSLQKMWKIFSTTRKKWKSHLGKEMICCKGCRTILCTRLLCEEDGMHKEYVLRCHPLPYALWAIPSYYWCFINSFIFYFFRRNNILIGFIDTNHFLWLFIL